MLRPAPRYLAMYTTRPAVASAPATAGSRVVADIQGNGNVGGFVGVWSSMPERFFGLLSFDLVGECEL